MQYTYFLREDKIYDDKGKEYIVYGIEAVTLDGKILQSIPDIFFNRQKAEAFVNLCNDCDLDIIHLASAVENALFE